MHAIILEAIEENTYLKVVTMSSEDVNGDVKITTGEEHTCVDWVRDYRSAKTGEKGLVLQIPNTDIVNWEEEEAEPILMQQQQNSTWVQQNLIKLGEIFGIDVHGHEEEAKELLRQIDRKEASVGRIGFCEGSDGRPALGNRFQLDWWSPTIGCIPSSSSILVRETWIRAVGIPLHLWSKKIFQEIGELCGGWIATEEETKLKNHMKWARILVKNDGRSLPMKVTISCGEIKYYFPIWAECKPTFELIPKNIIDVAGENETFYPAKGFTQQSSPENICNKVPKSYQFRDFGTRKHVSSEETTRK
ncbi:hypothetical protein FXO37_00618 [Capsicum annuum]|nr:hypothetical protein FXO37_00618 [Capsicum annuum]